MARASIPQLPCRSSYTQRLISDEEKWRGNLWCLRARQVDGHIKLAAPVGLTLLKLLYGFRVDLDPLGSLSTLAEDRQIGGESDFVRDPLERNDVRYDETSPMRT